jgi:hypothetical protein
LHAGSENVLLYFKNNLYIIKTLKEFQYVDDDGKDQGANVRQKAKDITNLLQDEARLREERRARAHMRDRMVSGRSGDAGGALEDEDESARRRTRTSSRRQENARKNTNKDDDELRRALEESKLTAEEDELRESRNIAEAIRLSEEEMARQSKALEDSNAASLFDDQPEEKCVLSGISAKSFPHHVFAGRICPATLYYYQLTTISFPSASNHSLRKCLCSHSLRPSILINSKPSKRRFRFVLMLWVISFRQSCSHRQSIYSNCSSNNCSSNNFSSNNFSSKPKKNGYDNSSFYNNNSSSCSSSSNNNSNNNNSYCH